MTTLSLITYLVATDTGFRTALLKDSEATLARWDLKASADELEVFSDLSHLLALPSQDLLAMLLAGPNAPLPWQGQLLSEHAVPSHVALQAG